MSPTQREDAFRDAAARLDTAREYLTVIVTNFPNGFHVAPDDPVRTTMLMTRKNAVLTRTDALAMATMQVIRASLNMVFEQCYERDCTATDDLQPCAGCGFVYCGTHRENGTIATGDVEYLCMDCTPGPDPIEFFTPRDDQRDADGRTSRARYCSVSLTFSVVKNSITSPGLTSL